MTLFHSEGFSQTNKPSDKMEGTGMNKAPPDKQKTASGSEWFILNMDRGAEWYPTGKHVIGMIRISYNRTSTHYKNGKSNGF